MDAFEAHRTFTAHLDMVDVSERNAPWLFMIAREHTQVPSASVAEQFLALRAVLAEAASQDEAVVRFD